MYLLDTDTCILFILVTGNTKEYQRIEGLKVENWVS